MEDVLAGVEEQYRRRVAQAGDDPRQRVATANPDGIRGQTDDAGHYLLMYSFNAAGAMLGEHEVRIETQQYSAADLAELKAAGRDVKQGVKLPRKYAKPGELTATVERGENEIDSVER